MPTFSLPQPPRKNDPAFDEWMVRLWKELGKTVKTNPVWNRADKHANVTLSNGELTATGNSTSNWYAARCSSSMRRGKWFWEVTVLNAADMMIGVMTASAALAGYPGYDTAGYGYYSVSGNSYTNATLTAYGNTYAAGDVIGVALDLDAAAIYFYKNGAIQNSGTAAYTGLSGTFFPAIGCYNTGSATANFGQTPFVYAVPDGYNTGIY